jgi:transposase
MALYARKLTEAEERQLKLWSVGDDPTMKHRAEIILFSNQGYRVPEIGPLVRSHPANLRKWIHRFNQKGCDGLRTVHSGGPRLRFSKQQRLEIVRLAQVRPRELGLNFTRWTLHRLAQQAARRGIVDCISHECVRQILKEAQRDHTVPPSRAIGGRGSESAYR